MTRLNLLLLAVLILSALGTVTAQHKARKAFIELQKEQQLKAQLEVEWGQLQLEQSTWAMHSRVEKEATNRLNMRVPDSGHVQVILPRGEKVDKPPTTKE
ncbi:cell division protein FtsL [Parachitinimonas caeni]|uniref:Cell division protein FtsL n=1 Tax=Parachitinimonas caeni TaxID=3031301 RepID=A0ABT7DQW4_9NEIS|nr:cell division protein FtsL [Parachitinimonas caeni]MDK2122456.1 cell division protein FtsL [Parachitinimonas caeni]